MADGLFDDLIPSKASAPAGGMFDDLLPSAAPTPRAAIPNAPLGEPDHVVTLPTVTVRPEPEAPGLLDRTLGAIATLGTLPGKAIGFAHNVVVPGVLGAIEQADLAGGFRRGATSTLASGLHAVTDAIDQGVQAPQRQLMEVLKPTVRNRETGEVDEEATARLRAGLADPLGAQGLAQESLGVEREINADRARAQAAIGPVPTLDDLVANPQEAIARKGASLLTTGVESAPAMALAIATRNPELGSSLLSGTTGAQEYTDLRTQGVDRGAAIPAALLTAATEKAGEQFGLEKVMAPGRLGSLLPAVAGEGGQESVTQLAQQNIEDQALGRQTPILDQVLGALDAGVIGAGMGSGAHGLSVGFDALGAPTSAPFPNAAPRAAPAMPVEVPQTNAIAPAPVAVLGDPQAAPVLHPAAQQRATAATPPPSSMPPLGHVEDTSDLDAMLGSVIPPDVAQQARELAANATPEQRQQAVQALGDSLAPMPPTPAPAPAAAAPAQPASAQELAPAAPQREAAPPATAAAPADIGATLDARATAEPEPVAAEYDALPETDGGRILNTDWARELSPEYREDRTRSADVHEVASAFIKRRYAEKLAQPTPEGMDSTVLFTAGGTGAGKTTGLRAAGDAFGKPEIIYDTNMNTLASAEQKVEQALAAGRHVEIAYVYREPVEALTGGAIPRAQRMASERGSGRTVPLAEHARTHTGVRGVIEALQERYAGDDRVNITAIDNSRGKGQERVVDLADLPAVEEDGLHERLSEALEDARANGLDEALYRGFAAEGRPDRGVEGNRRTHRRPDQSAPPGASRENPEAVTPAAGERPAAESAPPAETTSAVDRVGRVLSDLDGGGVLLNVRDDYRIAKVGDDRYSVGTFSGSGDIRHLDRAGVEAFLREQGDAAGEPSRAERAPPVEPSPSDDDKPAPSTPPRATGTKNAVTDAERSTEGRHPIVRDAAQSNEETLAKAMQTLRDDPSAGKVAVERLAREGAGKVSLADEAILLVHKTDLLNARDAAGKTLADPDASEEAKEVARREWAETEAEVALLDQAAVNSGREWGRLGQFRQRMLREDFTFAALERKERARLERQMTQDESAKIKAMADAIADLQAKVDKLQTRMANAESEGAYAELVKSMAKPVAKPRKTVEYLRNAANDARARLAATEDVPSRRGQSGAVISPTVFADLAVIGAYHIANGAAKFADWVGAMRADLGERFDQFKQDHPGIFKAAQKELEKPIKAETTVAEVLGTIDPANIKPKDVRKLVAAYVGEGMRGEPEIVAAAAKALNIEESTVRHLFVQSEARPPQTLTEAQEELRDLRKVVRLQNEIERLEAGTPKPARGAPAVDSPAVAAKKQELADLRASLKPQRDPDGRYQEMRGKQIEKRIAELQERIAAGDFAPHPRITRTLNAANQLAQYELENAKQEFLRHQFEDNLRRRSPLAKILGTVGDAFNLARAVMTSLDLSAVLRQGGMISFGHPVRALSSMGPSLQSFASDRAEHRVKAEIEGRANAPLYKRYGLQLTGIGSGPLTQIEEAYASRWLGRLPKAIGGGLVRGSGRAYTAFLNKLRADTFDAMAASLGRTRTLTEAEGKAIANYINVSTGRGKIPGTGENAGQVLNAVFFAPRLVASRFQLLAGQPLYGGSPRTRKLIVQEYARFMLGVGVVMGLSAFALAGDDDDPQKMIGLDPRSSDFLKVRIGKTYLDPMAGLAQVSTFLARELTGETANGKGEVKPLRTGYTLTDLLRAFGSDIPAHKYAKDGGLPRDTSSGAAVIGKFLQSKLAPVPGAIINTLTGEDYLGKKITPLDSAREMVTPMSFQNIADIMEEHGVAKGTAIEVLGLLGMGLQHRTETNAQQFAHFNTALADAKAKAEGDLAKLPVEQWPDALVAMKKEVGAPLEGVELAYYKADGKYGLAGEPKRDDEGRPVLKSNRIADEDAYRKNADAPEGDQVHHIIPDNLVRHHALMRRARELGYDLDASENLIGMPAKAGGDAIAHNTSHPDYDAEVFGALNEAQRRLKHEYGPLEDVPQEKIFNAVRDIERRMRSRIESRDVPTKDGRLAMIEELAQADA